MYYINYHTGAGNTTADTLDEAKRIADEGAAYTQELITIEDEDGNEISRRQWYGYNYANDADILPSSNPICFGSYGYYDDWT